MVERGHVVVLPRESPFRRPDTINRPIREGGEIGLPCGRQPRSQAIHPRAERHEETKLPRPGRNSNTNVRASRSTKPAPSRNPHAEETSHSQWYSTEKGEKELSGIESSLKRIEGAENVKMYRDQENHDVCFEFTCRSCQWNIKLPSTYPHGVTVLKCLDKSNKTLKRTREIKTGSYLDNMTQIISYIKSER